MGFFDDIGAGIVSGFKFVGETTIKTVTGAVDAVATVGNATIDVMDGSAFEKGGWVYDVGETVYDGASDVVDGTAFEQGGWVYGVGEDVVEGANDLADGSAFDKDGWVTRGTEDFVPFGGFGTSLVHLGAGNNEEFKAALLKGAQSGAEWYTGSYAAGRAKSKLAGAAIGARGQVGSLVAGDAIGDQLLNEEQQERFTGVSGGSLLASVAVGGFSGAMSKQARDVNKLRAKNIELRDGVNPSGDFVKYGPDGSVVHIDYGPQARGAWADRAAGYKYKKLHGQPIVDKLEEPLGEGIDSHFNQDPANQAATMATSVQYAGDVSAESAGESWISDVGEHFESSPGFQYHIDADGVVRWDGPYELGIRWNEFGQAVDGRSGLLLSGNPFADEAAFMPEPGEVGTTDDLPLGVVVADEGEWISDGETIGWVHEQPSTQIDDSGEIDYESLLSSSSSGEPADEGGISHGGGGAMSLAASNPEEDGSWISEDPELPDLGQSEDEPELAICGTADSDDEIPNLTSIVEDGPDDFDAQLSSVDTVEDAMSDMLEDLD